MILSPRDAKRVLRSIRQAKNDIRELLAGDAPCDRTKGTLVCLDIAELLICDEVTPDYCDTSQIIPIQKFIRAQNFVRAALIERVTSCPDTDQLFRD